MERIHHVRSKLEPMTGFSCSAVRAASGGGHEHRAGVSPLGHTGTCLPRDAVCGTDLAFSLVLTQDF